MSDFYNRVYVSTATTGTGAVTPGAAKSGEFCTFADVGVTQARPITYVLNEGTDFQLVRGFYNGTTLTRDRTLLSRIAGTIGTSNMTLAGAATIQIVECAEELDASYNFRNILYANGGCEIWQRGAGGAASMAVTASTTAYTADRWYLKTGATQASVVSQQAGLGNQSRWSARVQRNSGQTGTTTMYFEYPLTTDECVALRGKPLSLSLLLATGANWSPSSGTLTINAYFGTGAEGKRGSSAYTGETNLLSASVNLATGAAQDFYASSGGGTAATNITQGCLQFSWTPVGTAGANDWFAIDDVQLESSNVNTRFERLTFAASLLECQRHFAKTFPYATAPAQNAGIAGAVLGTVGMGSSAGSVANGDAVTWKFPVSMRASPTLTGYNPSANNANIRELCSFAGTAEDSAAPALTASTDGAVAIATSSPLNTTGGPALFHMQADAGL